MNIQISKNWNPETTSFNFDAINIVDEFPIRLCYKTNSLGFKPKAREVLWELTGSNRRPSACKADALNQLS